MIRPLLIHALHTLDLCWRANAVINAPFARPPRSLLMNKHPTGPQIRPSATSSRIFSTYTAENTNRDHPASSTLHPRRRTRNCDFARIEKMLHRIKARIDHRTSRVSPLSAPLVSEMGRVPVKGKLKERLLGRGIRRLEARLAARSPLRLTISPQATLNRRDVRI